MNKFIGIFIAVITVSIAVPLVLFAEKTSGKPAVSEYQENISLINEMLTINSAWGLSALQTMAIAESDFDQVAGFLERFRIIRDSLKKSELTSDAVPPDLKNKLYQFVSLMSGKELAIEHFKSKHAVMRNSIKYFPLASRSMILKANEIGDVELAGKLQDLRNRIEDYLKIPEEGAKSRILIDLSAMQDKLMSKSPAIVNLLGNFISHADVLVKGKVPMDEVVIRVTDNHANEVGGELTRLYTDYENARHTEFEATRTSQLTYMYILIGLLIVTGIFSGILYLIGVSRASKQLEQLVGERTQDLEAQIASASQAVTGVAHGNNMTNINNLVASVAHEINTPLAYVGSNLEVVQVGMEKMVSLKEELSSFNDLSKDDLQHYAQQVGILVDRLYSMMDDAMVDEFSEIVQDMRAGISQIEHVVQSLRDFSRKDQQETDWFDVNQCIKNALKMSSHDISDHIQIQKHMGTLPEMHGSASELNQVFINVIGNAIQAIKEIEDPAHQGMIKIRTVFENDLLVIDVLDNGRGMDEGVSRKVFDPFFTTKDVGKGTGLGMTISQKIIKQHKGKILVKSSIGKGTLIRIILPRSNKK